MNGFLRTDAQTQAAADTFLGIDSMVLSRFARNTALNRTNFGTLAVALTLAVNTHMGTPGYKVNIGICGTLVACDDQVR